MSQAIDQNRTQHGGVTMLSDILVPERNSFGAVRLALAVAVLASHSYWLTSGSTAAEPLVSITGHSLGEHAVQVFFFLSGLLVTQSLVASRGIGDFAAARALRIFPALIVCVLLTALVLGPWLSTYPASIYYGDPALLAYISKTAGLMTGSAPLPGLFALLPAQHVVNSSLWTLKYEVMCYGGLAVLGCAGFFASRWRVPAIAAVVLAIACLVVDAPELGETYGVADNVRYFGLFFGMGVLAYLLREHIEVAPALLLPLGSIFLVALGTRFGDLATALFLGYATIVVGSLDFGWLRRVANTHDLSYGVYIYACPVQQAMLQLYPGTPALPLTLAAIAVVVPLAGLSWSLIEKPALSLRRRFVSEPVQPATPSQIDRALRTATVVAAPDHSADAHSATPVPAAVMPAPLPAQHVSGPISARLAAMRAADASRELPRLPRRDWRYARRRIPQTRNNRLMADVTRYAPSRRARIRARLRPTYGQPAVVHFRPYLVRD